MAVLWNSSALVARSEERQPDSRFMIGSLCIHIKILFCKKAKIFQKTIAIGRAMEYIMCVLLSFLDKKTVLLGSWLPYLLRKTTGDIKYVLKNIWFSLEPLHY